MALKHVEQRRKPHGTYGTYCASILVTLFALLLTPAQTTASELKEETLAGWDRYINSACMRAEMRAKESPFLRISELPDTRRRVKAGEVSVWREGNGHAATVPHGLIHDWMGAVFIPRATISDVLAVTRDYDRFTEIYEPAVIEADVLEPDGNDDRFSMVSCRRCYS